MTRDVAASVHQRLLNIAKQNNRSFNDLLQYYALERWLFRLSRSAYAEQFILKGALLFAVWNAPATRPTRDIDLLGRMDNDPASISSVITEIIQTEVEDDGLVFDPNSAATVRITEDADYEGIRVKFLGHLGNTRIAMQIDIGFGDVVSPRPFRVTYPTILDQPAAELLAYNRETSIAEKYEAIVKLGEVNSRMKDFFDIWFLASNFEFNGLELAAAIQATFARRETPVEVAPVGLSEHFARNPTKSAQWKAFASRSLLAEIPGDLADIVAHVRDFMYPIVQAIHNNRKCERHWRPGGPWQP